MKILILWLTVASASVSAQSTISAGAPPVVFEGNSLKFNSNRNVEWSLSPGSKGTIDADGTYHAPSHVTAHQTVGGCQILPNNHILNTRIDSLPLHPKSQQWMHAANKGGAVLSSGRVRYAASFPVNLITSETPSEKMVFAYTPEANGPFHVLPPGEFKMEAGYYVEPFIGIDRHSIMVETDTCHVQEMYNFYPAGTNTYNSCPKCTSQSGVRYSGSNYTLAKAATDAASLYLTPLSLHRDEVLSGSIKHALRFTLSGDFTGASFVWPAMGGAGNNHGDVPPFGTRFRLRADFPLTSPNPYVTTLITQLKQYGLILADIGGQWDIDTADVDLYFDPDIRAAFKEVARLVTPANFEVVDESGFMIRPDSGDTTQDAETVIAKDQAGGAVKTTRVVLVGVTIGTETQYLVMQAGARGHKLRSWVNGSADKGVVWSTNASEGTLSTEGVYTPPAHLTGKKEFMLTARAHADSQVATSIKVTLLPEGPIRVDNGNPDSFTDSHGDVWDPECCTPFAVTYTYGAFLWPDSPDIKLYESDTVSWNDITYRLYVPPGKYRITAKIAEPSNTSPGLRKIHLDSQGQLIYRDVDLFALGGVRKPLDFDLPAEVGDDGKLDFAVRHVRGEQSLLSGFQVVPDPGIPHLEISPSGTGSIDIGKSRQFRVIAWYTPGKDVRWSLSPQVGSIDAQGLYKAPVTPVPEDTVVKVTAASASDTKLASSTSITVKKGIPFLRVNSGGGEFTDSQNHLWAGDYGFQGGVAYAGNAAIRGASSDLQKLYQTSRYAYRTDSFSYAFPLPNGMYNVTLKWAEYRTAAEVAAQQIAYKMSVKINDREVLNNFDPIAAAGGVAAAYDRTFPALVTNGEIRIVFSGQPGAGYVGSGINGIEIAPATPAAGTQGR